MTMEPISFLLIVLLLAIFTLMVYVFFFRKVETKEDSQSLLLMQQQIQELSRAMREQMSESNRLAQEGSRVQFRESK